MKTRKQQQDEARRQREYVGNYHGIGQYDHSAGASAIRAAKLPELIARADVSQPLFPQPRRDGFTKEDYAPFTVESLPQNHAAPAPVTKASIAQAIIDGLRNVGEKRKRLERPPK